MKREWKPGDVGIATQGRVFRVDVDGGRWVYDDGSGIDRPGLTEGIPPAGLRPLLVIDPETLPMDDLLRALDRWRQWSSLTHEVAAISALFDAIAEQTAPPRRPEPMTLGAVVEDVDGKTWVRVDPTGESPWALSESGLNERWASYSDIRHPSVVRPRDGA